MRLNHFWVLVALMVSCFTLNAYAEEENPEACNCQTIDLTDEEIAGGCTESVKAETCEMFRDTMMWQEQLQLEQQRRQMERRMEPRY